MQIHPILETPGIVIGYDSDNQWLYVDWRGEHTPESSRECCLLMLDSLRRWPCHKILNDNSNIVRTNVQLSDWSAWWLNEMLEAGLRYIAWIFPHDFAARQHTEQTLQSIQRPIVGTFDDVASAYIWLGRQLVR